MSEQPTVHRAQIAEARNILGEVIARARFGGEPTILVNRGKEAAAIVSMDFYEQALADRRVLSAIEQAVAAAPPEGQNQQLLEDAFRRFAENVSD